MNETAGSVIFSPTRPSNADDVDIETGLPLTVFKYPSPSSTILANNLNDTHTTSPKGTPTNKRAALPEEIPMLAGHLAHSDSSDTETLAIPVAMAAPKPAVRTSPYKYTASGISDYRNQLQAAKDSYVNVPSSSSNRQRFGGATKDAVTNPGYVVVGKTNETRP